MTLAPEQIAPLNIGIIGATGNVGTMMLRVLAERGVAIAGIRAAASSRSVGQRVECGSHHAIVEDLDHFDPAGLDVALFSAGAARATAHATRFAAAGCVVIDNSSALRMNDGIPLVVPEVNPAAALRHDGIIANPNCSTIQLVMALQPLHAAVGLERVHVTTFQSVSGTGLAAMGELAQQTESMAPVLASGDLVAAGSRASAERTATIYPHPIAFNVLPQCDSFDADGHTKEELKLTNETRKIMSLPDLPLAATCVRVPVLVGHAEAVHVQLGAALSPADARDLLAAAPGVRLVDDPSAGRYPMPIDAAGSDDVLVGRVRRDESMRHGLALFVVADNLRVGAATNAVRILELLAAHGRI